MRLLAMPLILVQLALGAAAEEPADAALPELRVEGAALVLDTETGLEDAEISHDDAEALRDLLRTHPSINKVRLNSGGGSIWAAEEIARIIIDYDLDTEVDGECASSCVTVFLAGKTRSMTRGSKIGFHGRTWAAADVEKYYESNKEDEHWATPFDYGSWIYEDTQTEIYQSMAYVVSRGVDGKFAIEMHAPREKMWYPPRAELEAAGVLRH